MNSIMKVQKKKKSLTRHWEFIYDQNKKDTINNMSMQNVYTRDPIDLPKVK